MRTRLLLASTVATVVAAASAQSPPGSRPPDSALTARSALVASTGETVGDALLRETPNGVLVKVDLTAAEAGVHAFHIHEVGRCDARSFQSAGGHFAPAGSQHGFLDAKGPHAGDLPNIHVPSDGRLSIELLIAGVTLRPGQRSLLDQDGSALVIHKNRDDYTSEPAGNAGDRIACGVVQY